MGRRTRTNLGEFFCEGSRLTCLALQERGWTLADLRRRLTTKSGDEVQAGVVDHWVYGDGLPSAHYARQLEEVLGVPAGSWGQKPTTSFSFEDAAVSEAA